MLEQTHEENLKSQILDIIKENFFIEGQEIFKTLCPNWTKPEILNGLTELFIKINGKTLFSRSGSLVDTAFFKNPLVPNKPLVFGELVCWSVETFDLLKTPLDLMNNLNNMVAEDSKILESVLAGLQNTFSTKSLFPTVNLIINSNNDDHLNQIMNVLKEPLYTYRIGARNFFSYPFVTQILDIGKGKLTHNNPNIVVTNDQEEFLKRASEGLIISMVDSDPSKNLVKNNLLEQAFNHKCKFITPFPMDGLSADDLDKIQQSINVNFKPDNHEVTAIFGGIVFYANWEIDSQNLKVMTERYVEDSFDESISPSITKIKAILEPHIHERPLSAILETLINYKTNESNEELTTLVNGLFVYGFITSLQMESSKILQEQIQLKISSSTEDIQKIVKNECLTLKLLHEVNTLMSSIENPEISGEELIEIFYKVFENCFKKPVDNKTKLIVITGSMDNKVSTTQLSDYLAKHTTYASLVPESESNIVISNIQEVNVPELISNCDENTIVSITTPEIMLGVPTTNGGEPITFDEFFIKIVQQGGKITMPFLVINPNKKLFETQLTKINTEVHLVAKQYGWNNLDPIIKLGDVIIMPSSDYRFGQSVEYPKQPDNDDIPGYI